MLETQAMAQSQAQEAFQALAKAAASRGRLAVDWSLVEAALKNPEASKKLNELCLSDSPSWKPSRGVWDWIGDRGAEGSRLAVKALKEKWIGPMESSAWAQMAKDALTPWGLAWGSEKLDAIKQFAGLFIHVALGKEYAQAEPTENEAKLCDAHKKLIKRARELLQADESLKGAAETGFALAMPMIVALEAGASSQAIGMIKRLSAARKALAFQAWGKGDGDFKKFIKERELEVKKAKENQAIPAMARAAFASDNDKALRVWLNGGRQEGLEDQWLAARWPDEEGQMRTLLHQAINGRAPLCAQELLSRGAHSGMMFMEGCAIEPANALRLALLNRAMLLKKESDDETEKKAQAWMIIAEKISRGVGESLIASETGISREEAAQYLEQATLGGISGIAGEVGARLQEGGLLLSQKIAEWARGAPPSELTREAPEKRNRSRL